MHSFFRKRAGNKDSIIFINLGKIGDLVISSVIFSNLHVFESRYKLFFVIREEYADLYRNCDRRIHLLPWNSRRYKWNIFYRLKFISMLRRLKAEYTIDLNYFRPILFDEVSILSGASTLLCLNDIPSSPDKLFAKSMQGYFNGESYASSMTQYEKHLLLLEFFQNGHINHFPSLSIDEDKKHSALSVLSSLIPDMEQRLIISIAPLSSSPLKNWGIENYIALIRVLIDNYGASILIHGSTDQTQYLSSLTVIDPTKIIDLSGRFSLQETMAAIGLSKLFIGNDSGLTHISLAFGIPTIGLIGGGSLGHFFPYQTSNRSMLLSVEMDCLGCGWKCIQQIPYCIRKLTVEEVLHHVAQFLS
ncbi:MAG TPA: glycosyltransferase family 9 protein [Nitrosomonas sp.]|nr:glycosyltransferase family 9 protein [Nitrosomonas sp.]